MAAMPGSGGYILPTLQSFPAGGKVPALTPPKKKKSKKKGAKKTQPAPTLLAYAPSASSLSSANARAASPVHRHVPRTAGFVPPLAGTPALRAQASISGPNQGTARGPASGRAGGAPATHRSMRSTRSGTSRSPSPPPARKVNVADLLSRLHPPPKSADVEKKVPRCPERAQFNASAPVDCFSPTPFLMAVPYDTRLLYRRNRH